MKQKIFFCGISELALWPQESFFCKWNSFDFLMVYIFDSETIFYFKSSEVCRSKYSLTVSLGKFSFCDRVITFFGWYTIWLPNPNSLSFTWHLFPVWQNLSLLLSSNFQWTPLEPKLYKSTWDCLQSKLYFFKTFMACSFTEERQWNVLCLYLFLCLVITRRSHVALQRSCTSVCYHE